MTVPRSSSKLDPEFQYKSDWLDGTDTKIVEREYPDFEARFAMQLLSTNGILMGDNDGEDSHGRAKAKPMEVEPLVHRALDIAQTFFAEARRRGLMLELPDQETARQRANEERERSDA